mmetsp:Transcript_54561/g.95381  ORF Transcript_54561/g.95381 Transcript_54561/m.95381 type:complete len:349 (-) Transcript_54561:71-1117(-)|eukprot:CAMPEP_0184987508 /NCGR_PEP_ID=MMETSP1098-20130426/21105_1 /TAXON_ID=89044 /ORGANISM="Spumella elongata, Strain CCAP 955/1" /LENGTH=348 /DNA_ID=CAMNT_0027512049 /DNA_START=77 /DNA_END=1123 /DNA_ORIENTATION=-
MIAQESPNTQDHSESLAKIENLEQGIIQHVKTSGIRKPRELQLIDEIMDLRRERRKLFSTLVQQLRVTEGLNAELGSQLTVVKEKYTTETSSLQSQLSALLAQKQGEQERFEEKLCRELEIQEEKSKFMEKINIDKVKKRCEEHINVLEAKLNEVISMKAKSDQKEARTIATELLSKAKAELEKRASDKITEYKKSIIAISAREKELEGSVARYKQLVSTYEEETSILKRKVATFDAENAARKMRERDLELSNRSLQEKVVFLSQLEQKLTETRTAHELEKESLLAQQKEEHSKHLAQVDERIRKVLAAKDAELQTLKETLKSRERKLKASEDAMAQINREIVSIKSR